MSTQNETPVKETKSQKAIREIKETRGFDSHEIIKETQKTLTVAFGYKKYNHSELIKRAYSKNENEVIKVSGEDTFEEFVKKVKEKIGK